MRGAQGEQPLRHLWRAVAATFNRTNNTRATSASSYRLLWSWSGPGSREAQGLTKPQAFLPDGSLKKLCAFDERLSSIQQQSRGAKVSGSEVKPGFVIMRKGRITQVLKVQHTVQGRGGAIIQVELRDLQSGLKSSERLRTSEGIDKVFMDDRTYTFLYEEGDTVNLMEPKTFEQLEVPKSFFGTAAAYLTDGMEVKVQYFDGKPLSASVPDRVTCTVIEAEPYFKGQTATPQYKKVILDNGQQLMTPSFVVAGDRVVVNTSENLYLTRAKE